MNKKVIMIFLGIIIWCGGVISGAYYQHKQVMEEQEKIAVLNCKLEQLHDTLLNTRLDVSYLRADVNKLQDNK